MTEVKIEIVPLFGDIGAEVRGVDLSNPLDDRTFSAVYEAWLEHHVLLFRGQDIDDSQMVAFSRCFGDLD